VIKFDYRMGGLVPSQPTEGSVARLASFLVLALASPAVADDGGGNGADSSDGKRGQKHAAFTATGLPPGVTIDPATGVISGLVDRKAITDGKMTYDAQISIQDINGASGRFSIKIVLPNKAPLATEDRAFVSPGISSVISVLENDIDGDGDELAILWAKSAQSSVVSVEGRSLRYTAADVAPNDDIITYEISDGHGGKAVGHVRVSTVK
jgi:large repetitive protein